MVQVGLWIHSQNIILIFQNIILEQAAVISNYQKKQTIQEKAWSIFKILIITNSLSDVRSDVYILHMIIEQELEMLMNYLEMK